MAKKKWIAFMMGLALSCASVSIMSACGGNESNSSAPSSSESSMEAPVTIEYKVKFNSLGGSEVEAQTVEKGKKATKPADPTREGYTFVEWQLNGNTYTFEGAVMGDITLTAKWQKNEAKKFTVTFVADGETFHTAEAVDGKQVLAPTSLPTRDGYVFDCWALDDVAYDFETPVTAELTLTAKWVKTWTVTFDAGEGVTVDPVVVKEGETVSAPEVSKKGYELSDWLLGDESYDFATPITADITLTAVWTEKEGEEEPTFEMSFVQGSADTIKVGETTTLAVETNVTGEIEWISSDEAVATVENGVVTGVSKGEVTITAKLGELSASKTITVKEVITYNNQIGIRINGNDVTPNANYFQMTTGANGETIITANKFQADATYAPALILKNVASKETYESLITEGYDRLVFNLAVNGEVSDLYVFGKALSEFPETDGVYTVEIKLSQLVYYYDTIYTIATSTKQVGQASSMPAKFITWKSPANDWSSVRSYVFTFSNAELKEAEIVVEPTFEMTFAQGSADTIKVGETTTLAVETNVTGEIEWISSDEAVATVENGVVTGVSKGEVTITAKLGELSASKTIYVEEVVVPKNQIGIRINGWNMTSSADYFNMVTGANGEKIITAKFQANETYSPALIVTNLADKADYEQLIADGYVKLTFNLAVDGDVSDLYVFGKKLTTFAKSSDGVYAIVVDLQVFVTYYDTMSTIATSPNQVGQASSISAKFITWKSPAGDWSTARNYTFTISNATLRKGALFSNNVGMRINGWDMSTNTSYMTMETGKDGEMVVGAKFQANETYAPALVLKNLKDKSYYETLIANGYTKLTFNLAVEGDVSDLYVFGKALNTFSQNDGVYTVVIDVQHIVNHYDTISTIATSGSQVGQATSMAAKLITWKSPAGDWSTTRNYVFTISNSAFVKAE